jgi:hypothetical protein
VDTAKVLYGARDERSPTAPGPLSLRAASANLFASDQSRTDQTRHRPSFSSATSDDPPRRAADQVRRGCLPRAVSHHRVERGGPRAARI